MKTKRLILALTTWTVVIVMSLHSCQTDSGYDNVIQENNLTEADLFVASEAYKNYSDMTKKQVTIELILWFGRFTKVQILPDWN